MKPYWLLILFLLGALGFIIPNEIMLDLGPAQELEYRILLYISLSSCLVCIVSIFQARTLVQLKLREGTRHKDVD